MRRVNLILSVGGILNALSREELTEVDIQIGNVLLFIEGSSDDLITRRDIQWRAFKNSHPVLYEVLATTFAGAQEAERAVWLPIGFYGAEELRLQLNALLRRHGFAEVPPSRSQSVSQLYQRLRHDCPQLHVVL